MKQKNKDLFKGLLLWLIHIPATYAIVILTMVYGWGLTVRSWPVIIVGYFLTAAVQKFTLSWAFRIIENAGWFDDKTEE